MNLPVQFGVCEWFCGSLHTYLFAINGDERGLQTNMRGVTNIKEQSICQKYSKLCHSCQGQIYHLLDTKK